MRDTSSDKEVMIFTLARLSEAEKKFMTKRQWIHRMHMAREKEGEFYTLFPHLKQDRKNIFNISG